MSDKPLTLRQVRKAGTRTRITEAARPMFVAKGYAAVTIRDVAKAVGMSTGAVFANFVDKAHLYATCTGRDPPDVAGFLRELSCCSPALTVDAFAGRAEFLLESLVGEEGVRALAAG